MKLKLPISAFTLSFSYYKINEYYKNYLVRCDYQLSAKRIGDSKYYDSFRPKKFLNFVDRRELKDRHLKYFKNIVRPLFLLSGSQTSTIEIMDESEITDCLKAFKDVDSIVCIGDDDFYIKVIEKCQNIESNSIPICIIPTGTINSFYNSFVNDTAVTMTEKICHATLICLNGKICNTSLNKVTISNSPGQFFINYIIFGEFSEYLHDFMNSNYFITKIWYFAKIWMHSLFSNTSLDDDNNSLENSHNLTIITGLKNFKISKLDNFYKLFTMHDNPSFFESYREDFTATKKIVLEFHEPYNIIYDNIISIEKIKSFSVEKSDTNFLFMK